MTERSITVRDTVALRAVLDGRHDELFWTFIIDSHGSFVPEGRLDRDKFLSHLSGRRTRGDEGLWAVVHHDVPVGVVEFSVDGVSAELDELYLLPRMRGAGLGSQLLRVTEQLMASHGGQAARLTVFVGNTEGIRFYERNGWHRSGVNSLFASADQLVMEKILPLRDTSALHPAVSG